MGNEIKVRKSKEETKGRRENCCLLNSLKFKIRFFLTEFLLFDYYPVMYIVPFIFYYH